MRSDAPEEKRKVIDSINVLDSFITQRLFQFEPKMGELWSRVRGNIFNRFTLIEQEEEKRNMLEESCK